MYIWFLTYFYLYISFCRCRTILYTTHHIGWGLYTIDYCEYVICGWLLLVLVYHSFGISSPSVPVTYRNFFIPHYDYIIVLPAHDYWLSIWFGIQYDPCDGTILLYVDCEFVLKCTLGIRKMKVQSFSSSILLVSTSTRIFVCCIFIYFGFGFYLSVCQIYIYIFQRIVVVAMFGFVVVWILWRLRRKLWFWCKLFILVVLLVLSWFDVDVCLRWLLHTVEWWWCA